MGGREVWKGSSKSKKSNTVINVRSFHKLDFSWWHRSWQYYSNSKFLEIRDQRIQVMEDHKNI